MPLLFTIDDVAHLCHSRAHLEKGLRDLPRDEQGHMAVHDECRIPRGDNYARSGDFDRLYTAYKLVTKLAPELCDLIAQAIAERNKRSVAAGKTGAERLLATSRDGIDRAGHRPTEWAEQLEDYAYVCEGYDAAPEAESDASGAGESTPELDAGTPPPPATHPPANAPTDAGLPITAPDTSIRPPGSLFGSAAVPLIPPRGGQE